jgi:hypothetical protein
MSDPLAADAVPYTTSGLRRAGIHPAPSSATLHRWRLRGLRGVRLVTFLRGGRRYVAPSALAEFFNAVTAAADGPSPPSAASRQSRSREIERAEEQLDGDGIR